MEMTEITNLRQYMGLKTNRHNRYKPKHWLDGWKLNYMECRLFNVNQRTSKGKFIHLSRFLHHEPMVPVMDVIMDIYQKYPTPSVVRVAKWCYPEHFKMDSGYWNKCREQVLATHPNACVCCGATENLHVDHKLPKSKYPHLMYCMENLQILCGRCNSIKHAKVEQKYLTELAHLLRLE